MLHTANLEVLTRTGFVEHNTKAYTTPNQKTTQGSQQNMTVQATNAKQQENRELDQMLVERAQQGDKRAFGLLVEKYHRKLGRLLSRMIRDQAEVEDVVQESFIKAYR
ncbi:MAG TPA: sigma factor, partial [Methylophilus sp.]